MKNKITIRGKIISLVIANKVASLYTEGKVAIWDDLTRHQKDSILDKRNPRLDLDNNSIIPYTGTRNSYTVNITEANKAAAFHSENTKTYVDYIDKNPDGTRATGTNSKFYLRKQFMKAGKFITELKDKNFKPLATREQQAIKILAAHKEFYKQYNKNPSVSQLDRFLTNNYAMPTDNRKLIKRILEENHLL